MLVTYPNFYNFKSRKEELISAAGCSLMKFTFDLSSLYTNHIKTKRKPLLLLKRKQEGS
jgi:hypothetical protein